MTSPGGQHRREVALGSRPHKHQDRHLLAILLVLALVVSCRDEPKPVPRISKAALATLEIDIARTPTMEQRKRGRPYRPVENPSVPAEQMERWRILWDAGLGVREPWDARPVCQEENSGCMDDWDYWHCYFFEGTSDSCRDPDLLPRIPKGPFRSPDAFVYEDFREELREMTDDD